MGQFVRGDVVVVPFPFTNQQAGKVRPTLVVATPLNDEAILCQITSTPREDGFSITVSQADFASGRLPHDSFVRVCHLFTADVNAIQRKAGQLKPAKTAQILERIIEILRK